jgi:hypothetical protein
VHIQVLLPVRLLVPLFVIIRVLVFFIIAAI